MQTFKDKGIIVTEVDKASFEEAVLQNKPVDSLGYESIGQLRVRAMPWPAFADLLEQAFRRDGHEVRRTGGGGADCARAVPATASAAARANRAKRDG